MTKQPSLSNAERNLLRAFITSDADWQSYRKETGINSAALTSAACLAYCRRYGINPSEAIRTQRALAQETYAPSPAPTQAETRAPIAPAEFFAPSPAPVQPSPAQAQSPSPAPVQHTDAATALAHALSLMQTSVDPAQVQALIDAAIDPLRAQIAQIESPAPVVQYVEQNTKLGELPSQRHPQAETLCKLALLRDHDGLRPNIWIAGPMGSGKTTMAKQAAKALGLDFGFHGSAMLPHEFVGFVDGHGHYHETQFVRLYRNGGLCLIDEIDGSSAQATLVLNAALANGVLSCPNGEIIERHPDFVCVGAANTWGHGATHEYVGRNRLDAAFLDRFSYKISVDYDAGMEKALAGGNADLVETIAQARAYAATQGLKVAISPRATAAMARAMESGIPMADAFDLVIGAMLTDQQRKDIKESCGLSRPRRAA